MKYSPTQVIASVISCELAMTSSYLLWLEAPGIAGIARPGQFVMLRCEDQTFLRRPLSIHRVSADKTRLAFLFAVVGQGTSWLAGLKPGERLDLLGPLGNGFDIAPGPKRAVLLAGGLGIAPLSFLADELASQSVRVALLYGAASSALLYPEHLLPATAEYVPATEDGSYGRRGFITAYLADYLSDDTALFACGPTPMYRTMAAMNGLADRDVQVSLETGMACGLGVCYGCTVKTRNGLKQVCKQGPIFNMHDIIWENLPDL